MQTSGVSLEALLGLQAPQQHCDLANALLATARLSQRTVNRGRRGNSSCIRITYDVKESRFRRNKVNVSKIIFDRISILALSGKMSISQKPEILVGNDAS